MREGVIADFDTAEAITSAFFAGRCQAFTTDVSGLAGLRISGSFPRHDSDKALAALALSLPVRTEQLGPWWTRVVPAEK